jgi:hypothetical protein
MNAGQNEPPIMITSDQLYKDYVEDEVAAEARYQDKQIWIVEARVDTFTESESGNYLMMRWFYKEIEDHEELVVEVLDLAYNSLQLEPQYSDGFSDTTNGYLVEVIGECLGILDDIVTVKIERIENFGDVSPTQTMPSAY